MSKLIAPSVDQLRRALSLAQEIEELQSELGSILDDQPKSIASTPVKRTKAAKAKGRKGGKRTMSPEARERIAAAQRARWSKARGEAASSTTSSNAEEGKTKPAKGKKRTISAEGRARIAEAAKRRWAKQRQDAA